jgi:hypothetical protein
VHHVDGVSLNNAHENLVICQDQAYHRLLHRRTLVVRAGGDPNCQRFCRLCSRARDLHLFGFDRSIADGHRSYCKDCGAARRRGSRTLPELKP